MDDIHAKRAENGADMVSLIIGGDGSSCGYGWVGPSVDTMFSVVAFDCATGYYSFAHEFGHNQGCLHDRAAEGRCSPSGASNFGWRDPSSQYRSIMSTDCSFISCTGSRGRSCTRIPQFSNKIVDNYEGGPMGDIDNNNAKQINNVRHEISGYLPKMWCLSGNNDCCGDGICQRDEDLQSCPEDCGNTLQTNLCSSVTCFPTEGIMFDIVAKSPITIQSLDIYVFEGGTCEVWTRPGTHEGIHSYSESGWELIAQHSFESTEFYQMVNIPTTSWTSSITLATGDRQAFYITLQTGQSILYDRGQGLTSAVNVENADVVIYEGSPKSYLFGPSRLPRRWHGTLIYTKSQDSFDENPSGTPSLSSSELPSSSIAPSMIPTSSPSTTTTPSLSNLPSLSIGPTGVLGLQPESCACQPSSWRFTLVFGQRCPGDGDQFGPQGILDQRCLQPFLSASLSNLEWRFVHTIQILELDRRFFVINQFEVPGGPFSDGDEFTYTSPGAAFDPGPLPAAFAVFYTGENVLGQAISASWSVTFSDECDVDPIVTGGELNILTHVVCLPLKQFQGCRIPLFSLFLLLL